MSAPIPHRLGEAPGATEPFDSLALSRLQELDPDGRLGLLRRVMGTFDNQLSRALDQLADARAAGDATAVQGIAHLLKSSSAAVGAMTLSQTCADIERRLREHRVDDLGAEVERLMQQCHASLTAVRAMLRE